MSVHEAGIIHRDLKPANVMFRDDGTIALVDFGSARRDADPVAKTLAGVVIGTPYYLSPEQALGGTADERSDLYSVGVMLYELLTGQRMYAAGSLVALFEMHKNAPIPKLPENLARHQRFLERLVAKNPEERYKNAAEALAALHGLLDVRSREPRDRVMGTFPFASKRGRPFGSGSRVSDIRKSISLIMPSPNSSWMSSLNVLPYALSRSSKR